jgi:hypothetical protein
MGNRIGPAAQEDYQNKERTRLRDLKNLRDARLLSLMSNKDFRGFIYDLIFSDFSEGCNVMGQSHTGNSQTFYNEGIRSLGIHLVNELQRVAPDNYIVMLAERLTVKKKEEEVKQAVLSTSKIED